jgi:hypothetical protein
MNSYSCLIAVLSWVRYNIISLGVGARQCRALTGVPHANEKRYIDKKIGALAR